MTKLVIISGLAADKFEDGVSQDVLALQAEECYGILSTTDGKSDADLLATFKEEVASTEDELPPEFLWPIFFQGTLAKDASDLEGTSVREVYDFAA